MKLLISGSTKATTVAVALVYVVVVVQSANRPAHNELNYGEKSILAGQCMHALFASKGQRLKSTFYEVSEGVFKLQFFPSFSSLCAA